MMPSERPLLLSALPPTRDQERLALVIATALFIAFVATLPFMQRQLPPHGAFIPIVDTALFLNDSITAALLYAQFCVVRSSGLYALATGYLFTAVIMIPHALTFPNALAPAGLVGAGIQSSVWLYIFWHLGLPPAAMAYALLKEREAGPLSGASLRLQVIAGVACVVLLVSGLTWIATAGAEFLPPIMVDQLRASSRWRDTAAPLLIVLNMASIGIVWRRRSSVLDLWLLVVLWAWFIETVLLSTTVYRYSVVWYAGRIYGLVSSCLVLFVLLSESTMLYARLALSLAARNREQEARRVALEVMVASIVHELHQPLSAISMNGDAGRRSLDHTPMDVRGLRACLADIATDSRRAGQILESLRTMFAERARAATLLDVNELIHEALAMLRLDTRSQAIDVRITPASPSLRLRGHRAQLLQVLQNLATNAIESMIANTDRPRVLTIRSSAEEQACVSIAVEDSGGGIDPEKTERIFDAFFTTKPKGMGLGLSICRLIVEAHGGRLTAAPGTPEGAIFRVVLPLASVDDASERVRE